MTNRNTEKDMKTRAYDHDPNIRKLIPSGIYHPPQLNVTMPAPDVEPIDLEDEPVSSLTLFARWCLIAVSAAIVAGLGVAFWP